MIIWLHSKKKVVPAGFRLIPIQDFRGLLNIRAIKDNLTTNPVNFVK
jgi:hypothetical protein